MALGRQIALARKPKMTQQALADAVRLTRTSIINIEKGRQQVLVHTLADIAHVLGVSPTALLPPQDSIEHLLRDASKKGRAWVLNSIAVPIKTRRE